MRQTEEKHGKNAKKKWRLAAILNILFKKIKVNMHSYK